MAAEHASGGVLLRLRCRCMAARIPHSARRRPRLPPTPLAALIRVSQAGGSPLDMCRVICGPDAMGKPPPNALTGRAAQVGTRPCRIQRCDT